ncbi:hemagglutinin family protein, partial [Citrobacter braakii]|nr:hemagglutinin family protein [Citrobacter braakii]
ALGPSAKTSSGSAVALGSYANAGATNSMALGANASATLANSVALGNNSLASATSSTAPNTVANAFVSGKTFSVNQAPTNGVVAVGSRQIQGVADGQISGTSTDAINGSQLYQVASGLDLNTDALGTSVAAALGGGAAYDSATGAWTAPSYTIQGTSYTNVGDALGGVNTSLTALTGAVGVVQRTATADVTTL